MIQPGSTPVAAQGSIFNPFNWFASSSAGAVPVTAAGRMASLTTRMAPLGAFIGRWGGNFAWNHGLGKSCNALTWVATHTTTHKVVGLGAAAAAGAAIAAGFYEAAENWTVQDFYDLNGARVAASELGFSLTDQAAIKEAADALARDREVKEHLSTHLRDPKSSALLPITEQIENLVAQEFGETARALQVAREHTLLTQGDLHNCINGLTTSTNAAIESKTEVTTRSDKASAEYIELLHRYSTKEADHARTQATLQHTQTDLEQCRAAAKKGWF